MIKNLTKKLRRMLATIISALLVINVVMPVEAKAVESPYDSGPLDGHLDNAYSFGYGGLLDLRLLNEWLQLQDGTNLSVADLRGVDQLWETSADNNQPANTHTIDLQALGLIYLNLGYLPLPLVGEDGLLQFVLGDAQVGALREYAHAPLATQAHGAAGVVSDSGGLELTQPGEGYNAKVDILSLLNLGGINLITENVITEAALELGAVSAVAKAPDMSDVPEETPPVCDTNLTATPVGDPADDTWVCSGYQVADAQLVLDSPLVGNVVTTLNSTLAGLLDTTEDALKLLLGEDSVLSAVYDIPVVGTALKGVVDISLEADIPAMDITSALLTDPLTSSDELVSIDLETGKITVDLKQLHGGNLNGLPANTSLLTDAQLSQITDTVTNLLTASKEQEPNGLNARLDKILRGDENKQGGLYATKIKLHSCVLGVDLFGIEFCTLEADIYTTLGGLLNPDVERTYSLTEYEANPYDFYYVDGMLGTVLGGVIAGLLGGVGLIVEGLLFGEGSGLLGGLLGDLQSAVISPLLLALNPVLTQVLDPIANIIINRQSEQVVEHGTVFTVSALELNVLDVGTAGEAVHLPLATASVMAQRTRLIDLDLDVAKIGDGRGLHTEGYTYDLVCAADGWSGLTAPGLTYDQLNVGSGFSYADNQLHLTGASGGLSLSEPLRVKPGTECTITANPAPAGHDALRPTPTGEDPTAARTPYTYFLGTDATGVLVSGDTPTGQPTSMSSTGVTLDGTQVKVDATDVGAEWKTHSFTFVVPEDAESHRVSVVHAYDLDRRDIDITKAVAGASIEDKFAFQYSLDGGENWLDGDTTIGDGETLTIKDVPVLNESLTDTTVMVREALGANPAGPLVSWKLNDADIATTYGGGYATTASFASGPVATVPTPNQQLDITNSYAAISVDKHIDGLLDGIGSTTLLPAGEDQMTIRYTVENTGAVAPDTITIYDLSLINDQFTPPAGITVDPTTGAVSGCELTFVDGVATCAFTVTLTEDFSHYKADEAEATIVATTTIGDRVVTAEGTDKHGALRLPDFAGMLPATGSQTLVWVMGLGLLVALAALVNYVRNRRN